ncbi:MAG: bifunctional nuclease family protein [Fidelibacterota bacterium]|nr:MAG: bifunctional nuclease family protein [Candidatus Neomarinimicrobiota bacterium]
MIQVQVEKISFYPPSKGYAILLKEMVGERFLPVIVGSFEAQSIALALEDVQMPRPMTHDLFCNILEDLSVEVSEVVISGLMEGTFYSKINLTSQIGTTDIDARPSDAIALALRVGAPIYATEAVMEEASVQEVVEQPVSPVSAVSSDESRSESNPPEEYLKRLHEQLDRAVSDENYERAAVLRDKIREIQTEASKQ